VTKTKRITPTTTGWEPAVLDEISDFVTIEEQEAVYFKRKLSLDGTVHLQFLGYEIRNQKRKRAAKIASCSYILQLRRDGDFSAFLEYNHSRFFYNGNLEEVIGNEMDYQDILLFHQVSPEEQ